MPALDGHVYRCPVGKVEYTPPELQVLDYKDVDRRPEHDAFGLAVLVFLLLMEGVHPFASVWTGGGEPPLLAEQIRRGRCPYVGNAGLRPPPFAPPFAMLPSLAQELFRRCFGPGLRAPAMRPTPREWQDALAAVERQLATCASNPRHRYSSHLGRECPWCARIARGIPDSFPQPGQQQPLPATPFTPVTKPQRQAPLPPPLSVAPRPVGVTMPGRMAVPQPVSFVAASPAPAPQSGTSRRKILLSVAVIGGAAALGRAVITKNGSAAASGSPKSVTVTYGTSTQTVTSKVVSTALVTIPVGTGPSAVAVNPIANRVYVANSNDNTVSVFSGS